MGDALAEVEFTEVGVVPLGLGAPGAEAAEATGVFRVASLTSLNFSMN